MERNQEGWLPAWRRYQLDYEDSYYDWYQDRQYQKELKRRSLPVRPIAKAKSKSAGH